MNKQEQRFWFHEIYKEHRKKKPKQTKKPKFTFHSQLRYKERLSNKYSIKQIEEDIKKNRISVKLKPTWVYSVRWKLGIYIITKDFLVITMYE